MVSTKTYIILSTIILAVILAIVFISLYKTPSQQIPAKTTIDNTTRQTSPLIETPTRPAWTQEGFYIIGSSSMPSFIVLKVNETHATALEIEIGTLDVSKLNNPQYIDLLIMRSRITTFKIDQGYWVMLPSPDEEGIRKVLQSLHYSVKNIEYLGQRNYARVYEVYADYKGMKMAIKIYVDINKSLIIDAITNYMGQSIHMWKVKESGTISTVDLQNIKQKLAEKGYKNRLREIFSLK